MADNLIDGAGSLPVARKRDHRSKRFKLLGSGRSPVKGLLLGMVMILPVALIALGIVLIWHR